VGGVVVVVVLVVAVVPVAVAVVSSSGGGSMHHHCEILVCKSMSFYNYYEFNEEVFGFSWARFESGLFILGKTDLKTYKVIL
jgi:hypothetical protein